MKKLIIKFLYLSITSIISIIIYDNRTYKDYNAAINVIKQVEQDKPDYFYDVLIETDVYNKFKNK